MALSKKISITVTGVVLIQLFSLNFGSRQKIKNKTRNTTASSYHSKVSFTQIKGALFFSCLSHGVKHYLYLHV